MEVTLTVTQLIFALGIALTGIATVFTWTQFKEAFTTILVGSMVTALGTGLTVYVCGQNRMIDQQITEAAERVQLEEKKREGLTRYNKERQDARDAVFESVPKQWQNLARVLAKEPINAELIFDEFEKLDDVPTITLEQEKEFLLRLGWDNDYRTLSLAMKLRPHLTFDIESMLQEQNPEVLVASSQTEKEK